MRYRWSAAGRPRRVDGDRSAELAYGEDAAAVGKVCKQNIKVLRMRTADAFSPHGVRFLTSHDRDQGQAQSGADRGPQRAGLRRQRARVAARTPASAQRLVVRSVSRGAHAQAAVDDQAGPSQRRRPNQLTVGWSSAAMIQDDFQHLGQESWQRQGGRRVQAFRRSCRWPTCCAPMTSRQPTGG